MEFQDFIQLIKKKTQTIFTIMLVLVMMVMIVSLLQPLKYSVRSRLLVVQNTTGSDAYTLSRSNEYLGNLLAEVVYSSSFYDQVKASKYNVEAAYFSGDYNQQLKKWNKTVQTKTQGDTGIIAINVYHPQVNEARKIALAVNDVLINKNQDYQGGQNVKISIIDQPLSSSYPTKPNLLNNGIMAVVAAFVIALFYIYIFPEDKNNLYLFGRKKEKPLNKTGRPADKLNMDLLERMEREEMIRREEQANRERKEEMRNISEGEDSRLNGNIRNILSR